MTTPTEITQDTQTNAQPTGETATMTTARHMTAHAEKRTNYLAKRDTLKTLTERLERYRKGAAAAREEAEASDKRWRELLRENDGDVTKEIRQLKRAVGDNRETADELEAMATELTEEHEARQVEVIAARTAYRQARQMAWDIEVETEFDHALAAMASTTEGQRLLSAMRLMQHKSERDVLLDPSFGDGQYSSFAADERRRVDAEIERRFPRRLVEGLAKQRQAQRLDATTQPDSLEALEPVAELACEQGYDGPRTAMQAEFAKRRRQIDAAQATGSEQHRA
ncbi:hypothetical protein [Salinicola sp. MIT1003]|uniref:hypothetical protein n=1 Tax=Salinicola sp. MIT1003 TaxID=1882734 RepID=UPI0008DE1BBC|nr:hypothetical protein [Salinicola sp. MIT1003]OHY99563.1 hypothetical protein BC443_08300 [Salinicola sp. MIT1003]